MDVDRARVIAHRVARHGLHRDGAAGDLAVWQLGVQDAGHGSPRVALAARLPEGAPVDEDAWRRCGPSAARRTWCAAPTCPP